MFHALPDNLAAWMLRYQADDRQGSEMDHDDDESGGDPLAAPQAVVDFVRDVLDDPQKTPVRSTRHPVSGSVEARLLAAYPLESG